MSQKNTCSCGEKHQGHMCILKSNGLWQDVEHLKSNPAVVCFICGEEANSADNVCSPEPLENEP